MDEPIYNKHYITVDERGCILDGWSDGPHPERNDARSICINGQGDYQFRLFGEENPDLYDKNGAIPLYKWDGVQTVRRTAQEIAADLAALPVPEVIPTVEQRVNLLETAVEAMNRAWDDLLARFGIAGTNK